MSKQPERSVEEIVEGIIKKMHDTGIDAFPCSKRQTDEGEAILTKIFTAEREAVRKERDKEWQECIQVGANKDEIFINPDKLEKLQALTQPTKLTKDKE